MSGKFKTGDKVFAKVRGYPYWPARVDACADETPNKMKYHVYFYGTAETAICKAEELAPYLENKEKYGKHLKRKGFNEGLQQLEKEINGGVAVPFSFAENSEDDADPGNESPTGEENAISTTMGGTTEKKKKYFTAMKRKRDSLDSLSEDISSELKRKYARVSTGTPGIQSDGDSPPNKLKVVSRSGRKIKPKKFADDEDEGGIDNDSSAYTENGVSRSASSSMFTELPGSSNLDLVSSPSSADSAFYRTKKSQGTSRMNSHSTHPIPDESVQSAGGSQVGMPSQNPNRAILARALSGHYVKIKLDDERPSHFEDERARQLWDAATARNAERLKSQIELGEYLPESIRKQLEGKAELTDAQKKEMKKEGELQRKRGKLRWLKQEAHLLELDAQIRSSLSLAKADTRRCLQLMEDMLSVKIDPLMLKKHPNIVETVKKLQMYIGNVSKWNLSEEEQLKFRASCEQIKAKASYMYHKFKTLFAVPSNVSFWNVFSQEVERFNEAVKHMSRDKMYALVVDPEKYNQSDDSEDGVESSKINNEMISSNQASPTFDESTNDGEDAPTEAESTS